MTWSKQPQIADLSSQITADSHFEPLLSCLQGRACELIENPYGNPGDKLIQAGFLQLFKRSSINVLKVSKIGDTFKPHPRADTLLLYGGGSVGGFYEASPKLRRSVKSLTGISKILLPQSAFDDREDLSHFEKIFARETSSLRIMKGMGNCTLAPDGALALDPSAHLPSFSNIISRNPKSKMGVYLRNDMEKFPTSNADYPESECDPSKLPMSQFLMRPSNHLKIVTNRLHFAIWSLYFRNEVILLSNSYHKNASLYETWLSSEALTPFARLIKFEGHR